MNLEKQDTDTINPYQPPQSDTAPRTSQQTKQYYVVGQKKFFALFFATFSLYAIYWFYEHWTIWKQRTGEKVWPVPRAIFNIFFVHSLFAKIHEDAISVSGSALPRLQLPATIFILGQIAMNMVDKFTGEDNIALSIAIMIIILVLTSWAMWQGQNQANIASQDDEGIQNSKLTAVNYIWVVLGSIFWALAIFGAFVDYAGLI